MTCNSIQTVFTDITEFNSVFTGRGESHFDFHTIYVIMIRGGEEGSSLMTFRNSVKLSNFKVHELSIYVLLLCLFQSFDGKGSNLQNKP